MTGNASSTGKTSDVRRPLVIAPGPARLPLSPAPAPAPRGRTASQSHVSVRSAERRVGRKATRCPCRGGSSSRLSVRLKELTRPLLVTDAPHPTPRPSARLVLAASSGLPLGRGAPRSRLPGPSPAQTPAPGAFRPLPPVQALPRPPRAALTAVPALAPSPAPSPGGAGQRQSPAFWPRRHPG